ncbi:MAG: phosphodiesterase [Pseudomonadaceae bacterium]|nr:MAG: phosphodiesterase [Pseudomonadaceae bacterium]
MKAEQRTVKVRHSILLVLGLLVVLFILGMWLMSSLNLNFAQQGMTELRERQIADTFYANLDRINSHHSMMEENTRDLARLTEQWQALGGTQADLRHMLQTALADFPDAYGANLLFDSHPAVRNSPFSLFAYRAGEQIRFDDDSSSWHQGSGYRRLRDALQAYPEQPALHWTPAYYRSRSDAVVISLSTPLKDREGNWLGIASTDWRADDIIRLVSRVEVTPSTFAFLLDRENRNLSSLALADTPQAQQLMDAITDRELHQHPLEANNRVALSERELLAPMQKDRLQLEDTDYALFFSTTRAGMVFGIGVPQAEIDAVLAPMRQSNLRIVLGIGSVLLVLSGVILFMVAGTLRQLHNLYTDSLTGLPNRARLLLDLHKRNQGSLILLNLDAFKEINDVYGHTCGDHVIQQLANSLGHYIESNPDCAHAQLYRMPADEFAIWLPGRLTTHLLQDHLADLHQFINNQTSRWENQQIPLSASLGLASSWQMDDQQQRAHDLLSSANIALKLARLSQNSLRIYDPEQGVRRDYELNLQWANQLKAALDSGRIQAYFQPIMDVKTGHIGKYECLVRLIDDDGVAVSPVEFLAVAKKIRLYRLLTRTMVEQAISRFRGTQLQFSLNLSGEDLLDSELTEFILQQLAESQLAGQVIFEILESEGIENYAAVRQFIDQAKALGCQIAIDDFGTGYSNFEHLLRLNVDLIKIDGSLIKQLDHDSTALTLTRGIVQFARELGIQTVAEFVYSEAVFEQVQNLGIDYAQGAHIGMPIADLLAEPQP